MDDGLESGRDAIGAGMRTGVAWKAASQITLQVSRLVVALVLARLLAPGEWGVAAMVLVFSGFVVVFTDNALGTALIQRRRLRHGDCSTVYWINAGVGIVLMLLGFAVSGPLADFYGEDEVQPLFMALSVGFLVSALGTTQIALLAREMQFRRLELRQIAATLVGAAAGITIALEGYGAWAIVGQQLAEIGASTLILWFVTPWRPRLSFSGASVRRLGGFAGNVFGENLLYQAGRNLTTLLIGRFLGAPALGTYALATNVILVPFTRIAAPLQQVFFPAFSRMGDDRERIADVWVRVTRLVGSISIPSLVGLAIVAPEFVDVVLGPRWEEATTVIQILAFVGVVQSLQTLTGEVLLALNRAGTLFRFTAVWFAASVGAFAIGVEWGIVGVATAYAVATALLEPLRAYLATRALGISVWRFVRSVGGVVQATAAMAAVVMAARAALLAVGVPAAARLVLLVVLGAAAYVAACLWRAPELSREIRSVASRRRGAVAPRVGPVEDPL